MDKRKERIKLKLDRVKNLSSPRHRSMSGSVILVMYGSPCEIFSTHCVFRHPLCFSSPLSPRPPELLIPVDLRVGPSILTQMNGSQTTVTAVNEYEQNETSGSWQGRHVDILKDNNYKNNK